MRSITVAAIVAAALAVLGCGSSATSGSSTSDASTSAGASPAAAKKAKNVAKREAVQEKAAAGKARDRLGEALDSASSAMVDFGEIAPVHAAAQDLAAVEADAGALRGALQAFGAKLEKVELPDAFAGRDKALVAANQKALDLLGEIGNGRDPGAAMDQVVAIKEATEKIRDAEQSLQQLLAKPPAAPTG